MLVVFLLQFLGLYEHWRLMRKEKRIKGKFINYIFSQYPGRSASVFLILVGTAWLSALSGAANYLNPLLLFTVIENGEIHIELATAITGAVITSFGVGYAVDSRFNKNNTPEGV